MQSHPNLRPKLPFKLISHKVAIQVSKMPGQEDCHKVLYGTLVDWQSHTNLRPRLPCKLPSHRATIQVLSPGSRTRGEILRKEGNKEREQCVFMLFTLVIANAINLYADQLVILTETFRTRLLHCKKRPGFHPYLIRIAPHFWYR